MTDTLLKTQSFKLKGRLYTLTVLSLLDCDIHLFTKQLDDVIKKAPKLFMGTPVVLDCSEIHTHFDLQALCHCIRERGLVPAALQSTNTRLCQIAKDMGLALLNATPHHDKSFLDSANAEPTKSTESCTNKLLTTPVRSGQQVVSNGDLIITSAVSHGAELLADGHIHVYGALRGRALAGIDGNQQARIFCQSLDAELVSIAGFYKLSDAFEPINGPCQIFLQDDRIQIEPI